MQEPYSVLGLKKGASEEEVRTAYRQMARRWHPDRFPAGPERMWAEKKMAEINEAHTAIVSGEAGRLSATPASESEQLKDVRRLMEIGQNNAARQALMRVESRSPEWNYLFGAVLLRLGEYDRAEAMLADNFVLPDIREGEVSLAAVWFEIQELRKKDGGEEHPLPRDLDFRMH